ncbi:MAG: twin-arginine translocase subunit TatC [Saprospiraceae bacterium]|nr:twin-arginine translocase subunit TatC [Saprospiraceae bacterium]MCF8251867.1 twin-arginine translocase subunit TatC [Saprospiraceae bacterium]MCF8283076.1 twin-arginine translocase subunit TatC [Bacteroidales bacterium]MCF8313544.1 twin-arginine translocase subunit TatC [Saprospiraceae bacterium]MCF8442615.1 twin-arginine translocase subunit TatC [Saprospiraceae bacterium]
MALDQIGIDGPGDGIKEVEKEMTFFDHLEELRWHIFRSVGVILLVAMGMFFMEDFVFSTVIFGPRNPEFITYRLICQLSNAIGMGDGLCFYPKDFHLITPDMGELFLTHIKMSFLIGFVLTIPYVFWEAWRFISPGLTDKERKASRGAVLVCSFLFTLGVLFGYFVISPFAISFLTGYELPGVESTPSLNSYIGYMIMFTIPTGLVFQLPVIAHVLTMIGLITPAFLKTYRRHAAVAIVIVAAIITPPDAFSQILVALPLFGLYEISILVSKRVERKKAMEAKMED